MDFWKAPIRSSGGNHYVLVIIDRLSIYVSTRALSSATAKMLYEDIMLKHGYMGYIQSDRGSHFLK
jgi:hypothetical protein